MTYSEENTNNTTLIHGNVSVDDFKTIKDSIKTSSDAATPKIRSSKINGPAKELSDFEKRMGFLTPVIWGHVIRFILFHLSPFVWAAVNISYGEYPRWETWVFEFVCALLANFGATAGAHRLWSHKAFKVTVPLKVILLFCYSIAGEVTVHQWARDHRVHHKFSDTNADPYNVSRGFFYAHAGWLMMRRHPDIIREVNKIDMSDIDNDPIVRFHNTYFIWFKLTFSFIMPTVIPVLCWGETWNLSAWTMLVRYIICVNCMCTINSFAHTFGYKSYDKNIKPTENWLVSLVTNGEGWHNYHHTFPWDYKAAEIPYYFNGTATMIELFSKIGWAYDLKEASSNLVETVSKKRGDTANIRNIGL